MKDNMKDFKDLIKIADVYGTETRDLLEKKEAGQLDEGWWEDLTGFVKKTLGMNDAQAAEIAQDVQKKTGADPEADKPLDIKNPKDASADAPADAPAAPAPKGLDVTTPNLMKAYNAGGKKPMDNIKAMQQALTDAGHDTKGIDGKYGPGTFAAVKSFQTAQGLKADGQAGPNTMKALQATAAPVAKPTPKPAAPTAQSAPTQPSGGAATGPDGNPTGAAATATAPDGNPTEPPADQAAAQASQQGVDAADVAAASGQAQAGVDGADQAELDAGAGQPQGDDPMTAANQAKDRKDKKPKTDRQQMATTEAVNEASMNISMNGTDAREVAELVGILKNAGMEEPKMMAIKALPKMGPMDMDKPSPMGMDRSSPLHSMSSSPCSEDEAEYNALMDEWDNSPDPEYKDDDYMLNDLAGGINRPKKMYPATQPGDNPMAVKEALWKALQEKYTTNEGSRGKKKKIMASRGKMEDTKTTEGSRGKKMKLKASRGEKLNASRGNKLMASRGKDKKTTEGSRGKKSRGKKSRG